MSISKAGEQSGLKVRKCPWTHAVDGKCLEYVSEKNTRSFSLDRNDPKCPNCGLYMTLLDPTHDEMDQPIAEPRS